MAAARAAGSGGSTSQASKLDRARAAGRAGQPAPAFIDDAASQNAYLQGQADATDDADTAAAPPSSAPAGKIPKPRSKAPAKAKKAPSAPQGPATPPPAQSGWAGAPSFATPGAVPSGDIAGGLLGLIAVAFMINVLKGTGTAWLKAKFLNDVPGGTTSTPNTAPGLFSNSLNGVAAASGDTATYSTTDQNGGTAASIASGTAGGVEDPSIADAQPGTTAAIKALLTQLDGGS